MQSRGIPLRPQERRTYYGGKIDFSIHGQLTSPINILGKQAVTRVIHLFIQAF